MRGYNEADIRRAVNEVIAAGMEKFLYQEPLSSKRTNRSSKERGSK